MSDKNMSAIELTEDELKAVTGAQDFYVTRIGEVLISPPETGNNTGNGSMTTGSNQSSSQTKQSRQVTIVQDL